MNQNELNKLVQSLKPLDIRFYPERSEDCPAVSICEALGNLRAACRMGGNPEKTPTNYCMAGMMILIARATGQLTKKDSDEIEVRRARIGFHPQDGV